MTIGFLTPVVPQGEREKNGITIVGSRRTRMTATKKPRSLARPGLSCQSETLGAYSLMASSLGVATNCSSVF